MAAPKMQPQPALPAELVGISVEGRGPLRKYSAVKVTLAGDRVTSRAVIEETAHKDMAIDAARRALWKLRVPVDADVLVHERPRGASGMGDMPCCKKPFDARVDRITDDRASVTCSGAR